MTTTTWVKHVADEPTPHAPERETQTATAAPPSRGAGPIRIGLIDNSKDNAKLLLDLIGERLRADLGAEILHARKYTSALGADDEVIERFAREADCVITAMAD